MFRLRCVPVNRVVVLLPTRTGTARIVSILSRTVDVTVTVKVGTVVIVTTVTIAMNIEEMIEMIDEGARKRKTEAMAGSILFAKTLVDQEEVAKVIEAVTVVIEKIEGVPETGAVRTVVKESDVTTTIGVAAKVVEAKLE